MRQNMEKVLERDEKLTDLDSRAGICWFVARPFASHAVKEHINFSIYDFLCSIIVGLSLNIFCCEFLFRIKSNRGWMIAKYQF